MTQPFPCGRAKYRRLQHDVALLIPLKQYCAEVYCSPSTAIYRIERGQIIGYKIQHQWYILPPDE